jgi:uncharacterized SAM-binding protein YcdF (DUF218 family)
MDILAKRMSILGLSAHPEAGRNCPPGGERRRGPEWLRHLVAVIAAETAGRSNPGAGTPTATLERRLAREPPNRFLGPMFFWLKKLIGTWLMPLPFCLLIFVVGLVLTRTKRARLGRALIVSGIVLLLLFGNKFVSLSLVRPLEFKYSAIPELAADAPVPTQLAACRFVVVLGSGNGNTPGRAALAQLSQSAQARIVEAVRLLRALPDAKLVLSGPPVGTRPSHATVLARAAASLGITPDRVLLIEQVRDTEDESLAVKQRLGDAPFALVTSSWHMPRAMALFHHAGLKPLACPADFTGADDGEWHWGDLLWDVESLERSTWAVRERIGYLWIWLRGKG